MDFSSFVSASRALWSASLSVRRRLWSLCRRKSRLSCMSSSWCLSEAITASCSVARWVSSSGQSCFTCHHITHTYSHTYTQSPCHTQSHIHTVTTSHTVTHTHSHHVTHSYCEFMHASTSRKKANTSKVGWF